LTTASWLSGYKPNADTANLLTAADDVKYLQPNTRPFTIIVEGNVASGKSTLLALLEELEGFETVPEPVSRWQNVSGTNLLEEMINDGNRWLTTFQLYSSKTRLENSLNAKMDTKYRVMERSLYSEYYCFGQIIKDDHGITSGEYAVLSKWFNFLMNYPGVDLGADLIIYLRTDPHILEKRIEKRGRKEETEAVHIEFLRKLDQYHENWLINGAFPVPAPVLIVDGGVDPKTTRQQVLQGLMDHIPGVIFKKKPQHTSN